MTTVMLNDSVCETSPLGDQIWYKKGQKHVYHRTDGPAIIRSDNTELWYIDNCLHRTGGPAIMMPDGYQEWLVQGKHHRMDGPAIVRPNGEQEYWQYGRHITDEILAWMSQKQFTFPLNEEAQLEFMLTWS